MPAPANVDDYIAAQPAEAQPRLRELRAVVRSVAPGAVETISYGMPAYKLGGRSVYFAAARRHCAVYSTIGVPVEELRGYTTAKGTVRFPLDRPIPADLVGRLVSAKLFGQAEPE